MINDAIEVAGSAEQLGIIGILFFVILVLGWTVWHIFKQRDECIDERALQLKEFNEALLNTKDQIIEIKDNHNDAVNNLEIRLAKVTTEITVRKEEEQKNIANMRDLQLSVLEKVNGASNDGNSKS